VIDKQQELIARMTGGEPFTCGALCSLARGKSERFAIIITILKLWCFGKIAFTREAGRVVWRAVAREGGRA